MKRIYIIAVIAAVLAGIGLFSFLTSLQKRAETNLEDVVVAVADIPEHTTLTPDLVAIKQIPREGIHPNAARQVAEVVGLVTACKMIAQEEMLLPKLNKVGETAGGLAYAVRENMRAITVSVDEISGLAGFIRPGDRLDIAAVLNLQLGPTSLFLLQNIEVLATGTTLVATGKQQGYTSVTLLVTPEEALKINLAAASGSMRMTLRNPTDSAITSVEPKTINSLGT